MERITKKKKTIMKKLFGRGGDSSAPPAQGKAATRSSFVGKSFTVGKHHVTVEEVVAEGGFAIVFLVKAGEKGWRGNGRLGERGDSRQWQVS